MHYFFLDQEGSGPFSYNTVIYLSIAEWTATCDGHNGRGLFSCLELEEDPRIHNSFCNESGW